MRVVVSQVVRRGTACVMKSARTSAGVSCAAKACARGHAALGGERDQLSGMGVGESKIAALYSRLAALADALILTLMAKKRWNYRKYSYIFV